MESPTVYRNKKALLARYIHKTDAILDVGFSGQAVQKGSLTWPHEIIKKYSDDVWAVDLHIDRSNFPDTERYQESSAENFSFPNKKFNTIFAGDLIEHLPNPGLFLSTCGEHMSSESVLLLTTPNCFNLFNIAEKLTKDEPTVNSDHACYFNHKTLRVLLEKSGFTVQKIAYIYTLEYTHAESWKKKFLNLCYWILSKVTPKFLETLVIVAKKR